MEQIKYEFEFTGKHLVSASKVIDSIIEYLPEINSFLDFGCGMGVFSAAMEEKGFTNFKMVDHPLLPSDKLLVKRKENFLPVDLDKNLPELRKFDLAICLEVLEHFSNKRSLELLDFLVDSSDLILFSAAIPRQLGTGHINEQWHDYWHSEFAKRGFGYFDRFKIDLINDKNILYCYRQNLFLYFNLKNINDFDNTKNITSDEIFLISSHIIKRPYGFGEVLKMLPSSFKRSFLAFLQRF